MPYLHQTVTVFPNKEYILELKISAIPDILNVSYTVGDSNFITTGVKRINFNTGDNSTIEIRLTNNESAPSSLSVDYLFLKLRKW